MRSLDTAREACEARHPGLLKTVGEVPLAEREAPGSPVIDLFRTHDGPTLLIPAEFGGQGAGALEAVRVMRAIGSVSPSLGAAATMHHFMVGTLFAIASEPGALAPDQVELLRAVAPSRLLIASGWAEGRTEQNILAPSLVARPTDGGYLVSGSKKPCSLARSMDLLTASAVVPGPDGEPSLAVMVIPAGSPGMTVHPFWSTPVLAGAESEEVRLEDVHVPEDLVIRPAAEQPEAFDALLMSGFVWFELLISSVYAGAAGALVERALRAGRGSVVERAAMGARYESAVALIESCARSADEGALDGDAVAASLVARYTVQDSLRAATDQAVELLGGIAYIGSPEVAYLASAARPLAFHPPSRSSTAQSLVDYFDGGPLVLA
jgi:isobutylamine N-monooxygenase